MWVVPPIIGMWVESYVLVVWDSECATVGGPAGIMDMWVGGEWRGRAEEWPCVPRRVNKLVPCAMPTGSSRPLSMPLSNQSRWEDDVTSSVLDL